MIFVRASSEIRDPSTISAGTIAATASAPTGTWRVAENRPSVSEPKIIRSRP
jgi:hypothetical protein